MVNQQDKTKTDLQTKTEVMLIRSQYILYKTSMVMIGTQSTDPYMEATLA